MGAGTVCNRREGRRNLNYWSLGAHSVVKEQVLKASGIIKVQKLETQEVGTLNGFSMGRFPS